MELIIFTRNLIASHYYLRRVGNRFTWPNEPSNSYICSLWTDNGISILKWGEGLFEYTHFNFYVSLC